ncbi:hypothetical protein [Streptomyces sp. NPDC088864]|uniref:hypothetical protein n=1 Tax=Streptomyces sp. NPDC088864 TaxID=3365910 RepID=UPI00382CF307
MSAEDEFGEGVSMEALKEAIGRSGYLMQSAVVDKLSRHFPVLEPNSFIQEEWTYIDGDSGEVRAVDALVDYAIERSERKAPGGVSSYLNLIVECKQSTMPYVFFLRDQPLSVTMNFPEFGGVGKGYIPLFFGSEDFDADEQRKKNFPGYGMTYHDLLHLVEIPFFRGMCPLAISLSKAAWRKGGSLELTGEDAYRSLTLPIFKAMDHLANLVKPDEKAGHPRYLNLRFTLGLAVLRAPMVAVRRDSSGETLERVPWVRMSRLEPAASSKGGRKRTEGNVRLYDIVHEEFLDEYLSFLKDAVREAARNVKRWEEVVSDGIGCTCKAYSRPDTPEGDVDCHRIHKEQVRWIKDGGTIEPKYFISAILYEAEGSGVEKAVEGNAESKEMVRAVPPVGLTRHVPRQMEDDSPQAATGTDDAAHGDT